MLWIFQTVHVQPRSYKPHLQHDARRGAAPRAAAAIRRPSARSTARSRSSPGRHHRPDGALARSADALLPREAARGAGAVRRRPHRHAPRRARTPTASPASFIRATRAWCRRTTSSSSRWSAVPIPTRPTRASSRRRAARCPRILDEIGRRYIGRWRDEIDEVAAAHRPRTATAPIGVSFSGGIDSGSVFLVTYHAMLRLGCRRRGSRRSCWISATGRRRAGARVPGTPGLSLFLEEIAGRPTISTSTQTLRVLEDYKPLDVECAAMGLRSARASAQRYPDWRHLARRRRRRREPEGLSDRGEPRADDPQRRRQPDAVPGGLGRRPHQALAHLQRRPEPELRADLRARRAATGSPASAPTRGRTSIEVAEGIPFADADRLRRAERSTR